MGLIADTLRLPIRNITPVPLPKVGASSFTQPQANYQQLARAYSGHEIVYSAIELLASSAGEPHICGRRWRRNSPIVRNPRAAIRDLRNEMVSKGVMRPNAALVRNGYVEELPDHPLVELLNAPNPYLSRGQFWGTGVMDRCLAGNFYALKVRSSTFPNSYPLELWRLRPDRVRIIPSQANYIEGYEYNTGTEKVVYPASDVMHWKTRNPLNDYYGMPPLMPILGRLDIDWYMQSFLRGFFERGGTGPGSLLTVKNKLSDEAKEEIRERHKKQFGHVGGQNEMMVLDQTEATYQQFGLSRGIRDALPKELDAVSEARIAMVFGIPGSILGLLIGYESSSYANKRADWQVLWDITMVPMLSDADDVLNLSLIPEFSGIDEVYFDTDDIRALQEDVDKVQERERKNFQAGGISFEEFRDAIGRNPDVNEGTLMLPVNVGAVSLSKLLDQETGAAMEVQAQALNGAQIASLLAVLQAVTDGLLAPESAKGMLKASFPSLTDDLIDQMVDAAANFEPDMVPALPPPEPMPAEPMAAIIPEPRCPKCRNRVGRNIQEGGELMCRHCNSAFLVSVNGV